MTARQLEQVLRDLPEEVKDCQLSCSNEYKVNYVIFNVEKQRVDLAGSEYRSIDGTIIDCNPNKEYELV